MVEIIFFNIMRFIGWGFIILVALVILFAIVALLVLLYDYLSGGPWRDARDEKRRLRVILKELKELRCSIVKHDGEENFPYYATREDYLALAAGYQTLSENTEKLVSAIERLPKEAMSIRHFEDVQSQALKVRGLVGA